MKMYEKLNIDLTTREGFSKASNFCKKPYCREQCERYNSCQSCREEFLFREVKEDMCLNCKKARTCYEERKCCNEYIERVKENGKNN